MDEMKKPEAGIKADGFKVTRPTLGSKPSRKPGGVNPAASVHCDLPHFNLPNGGDGNHFDVAHSDTTLGKKANIDIAISGRLGKAELLKLAELGLTIENCKISLPSDKTAEFQKIIALKKG